MGHGGKREGAGRPPVKVEEKKNYILAQVMKRLTGEEEDDESKIAFLMRWAEEDAKGAYKFIAEHTFGRPKEQVEQTITGGEQPIITLLPSKKDE